MADAQKKNGLREIVLLIFAVVSFGFAVAAGTAASISRSRTDIEDSLMLNASKKAQAVYEVQQTVLQRLSVVETNYQNIDRRLEEILLELRATH